MWVFFWIECGADCMFFYYKKLNVHVLGQHDNLVIGEGKVVGLCFRASMLYKLKN